MQAYFSTILPSHSSKFPFYSNTAAFSLRQQCKGPVLSVLSLLFAGQSLRFSSTPWSVCPLPPFGIRLFKENASLFFQYGTLMQSSISSRTLAFSYSLCQPSSPYSYPRSRKLSSSLFSALVSCKSIPTPCLFEQLKVYWSNKKQPALAQSPYSVSIFSKSRQNQPTQLGITWMQQLGLCWSSAWPSFPHPYQRCVRLSSKSCLKFQVSLRRNCTPTPTPDKAFRKGLTWKLEQVAFATAAAMTRLLVPPHYAKTQTIRSSTSNKTANPQATTQLQPT